ncbi:TPA: DUF47 family protein [archaeon]|uniref:DUF47 family protein n=1 Tax=Candidatus Naiadarchaeum limnaeum TaxID=2756139 RepID=A0A832UZQ3_9ARCH|nr:DUF47 family protein [Candidatus Naiadarchaeales archaeon SRR2090153.bin1042]HIK00289.1 DUF47 family protein [Candidatus Naiadarchaeum limnaeum]
MEILPVLRADKGKEFYKTLETFITEVHSSVKYLNDTVRNYCDGKSREARKFANFVIDFETKADSSRRSLEKMLYTGVVLPFGRGAKYELLESVDDVADKAELVARLILIERLKVRQNLRKDLKELSGTVLEVVNNLKEAVLQLDINLDKAVAHATSVELMREKARQIEFKLIEKLFSKMRADINIILLKELISLIAAVADKAEEAADRVVSLAVKYQG